MKTFPGRRKAGTAPHVTVTVDDRIAVADTGCPTWPLTTASAARSASLQQRSPGSSASGLTRR